MKIGSTSISSGPRHEHARWLFDRGPEETFQTTKRWRSEKILKKCYTVKRNRGRTCLRLCITRMPVAGPSWKVTEEAAGRRRNRTVTTWHRDGVSDEENWPGLPPRFFRVIKIKLILTKHIIIHHRLWNQKTNCLCITYYYDRR